MEIRRKNTMKIILIGVYILLTVSGLILMKKGGNTGTINVKDGTFTFGINIVSAIVFICYIGSFLIFTRLIGMFNLSYIFPVLTGIVQVISLVASAIVFKEEMNWQTVIGASAIIIGIIVMNLKR